MTRGTCPWSCFGPHARAHARAHARDEGQEGGITTLTPPLPVEWTHLWVRPSSHILGEGDNGVLIPIGELPQRDNRLPEVFTRGKVARLREERRGMCVLTSRKD